MLLHNMLTPFTLLATLYSLRSINAQKTINFNWYNPYRNEFSPLQASVGDTIKFQWQGFHNVYIHPTGTCSTTNRKLVGSSPSSTYTFTEEDANNGEVFFACDVGSHCEMGQRVRVFVSPAPSSSSMSAEIEDIDVTWFIPSGSILPGKEAKVGDKAVFKWSSFHNVYIHPTGDCKTSDRIFVGRSSPSSYVFTEADAEKGKVVFACDVGSHCESGQIITFTVSPSRSVTDSPTLSPTKTTISESPSASPVTLTLPNITTSPTSSQV